MPAHQWLKKDREYVWHPYTQMKDCRKVPPLLINSAKGVKLYSEEGNMYYDTISSWWCNVHGHNHPKIKKAICKQLDFLDHILFAGLTHKPAIGLAEKLVSLTPANLTKVFFSDNGSTAVEVALKMSFQYWQNVGASKKKRFVSLDMGYHGDTIGAMSVSGVDLFNKIFSPLFLPSFKVPSPYCYRCPRKKERDSCNIDCIKPLEDLCKKKSKEIAAIILEPMVMAASGMIIYPKEYLIKVAELAKRYNIHLILDEVATGFGRTGKMFALEHASVEPDFLCLSKGITSGYLPLAVTLTTDKVYQAFYGDYEERKTFFHGHTFTANPISCSAALASLNIFKEEDTLKRVKEIIPFFHLRMEGFRDFPLVGDVRYLGLIGAIELVKDKKTKEGFPFEKRIGFKAYQLGLKRQLILRPLGNVIYLFLPLCITKRDLEEILNRVYLVVKALQTQK
ncbi:MAG: adenosylmethionine--8-amino-7-oxononanoate transaminase [Candidatus Omnitrophota bacterium]|nr:adenosylmethionine--8-amino-7-oxononanoate transaminase [Candidatus Omnitrophota bacterium]